MPSTNKYPVILIHGINDSAKNMRHIKKHLSEFGFIVHSVDLLPSSGEVGIEVLASQLDNFINTKIECYQQFNLIGFSMGGLICRYYLQRLNGLSRIAHFITISSPHFGTLTAYLSNKMAARQMRTNSNFIKDINDDLKILKSIKVTSIWTPLDLMILPASSSSLSVGKEIRVWCVLHPLMLRSIKCMEIIKDELLT